VRRIWQSTLPEGTAKVKRGRGNFLENLLLCNILHNFDIGSFCVGAVYRLKLRIRFVSAALRLVGPPET
jgi:hypothetical protein